MFGQVQTIDFEVNLQNDRKLFHGRSLVDALQGILGVVRGQEDLRRRQLDHGFGVACDQRLELVDKGFFGRVATGALVLRLETEGLKACGSKRHFHVAKGCEKDYARKMPSRRKCTASLRTGRLRRGALVVLPQAYVNAGEELFTFILQRRAHGTTSNALGFIQGHLVMTEPILRSEGVKFIRFHHGR